MDRLNKMMIEAGFSGPAAIVFLAPSGQRGQFRFADFRL
jgi:hypothetical protein